MTCCSHRALAGGGPCQRLAQTKGLQEQWSEECVVQCVDAVPTLSYSEVRLGDGPI